MNWEDGLITAFNSHPVVFGILLLIIILIFRKQLNMILINLSNALNSRVSGYNQVINEMKNGHKTNFRDDLDWNNEITKKLQENVQIIIKRINNIEQKLINDFNKFNSLEEKISLIIKLIKK